jgi:STE24 endopeptidase
LYSNFLFLLVVFLIPSLSLGKAPSLIISPVISFFLGLTLYFFTLLLILLQNYYLFPLKFKKSTLLILTNLELIIFLIIYFYFLGADRVVLSLFPLQTLSYFSAIIFYFSGIWFFHFTTTFFSLKIDNTRAFREILFLIPFTIPFLIFSLGLDFILSNPESFLVRFFYETSPKISEVLIGTTTFIFAVFMMLVFPFVIQLIWQCKPLLQDDPELTKKLEHICKNAQFKHSGIKTWTIMNDSLTAAIVGIIPQIRFVIFTKKLLKKLSFNAVSAILAHEIGHWYRNHLLIYPFIMLGLVFVLKTFETKFLDSLPFFVFFSGYMLCLMVYFRIVFGFFSRIFERQADLHVYELNISPHYMIEALDNVAKATGNSHKVPSWHHFSIQERIDFLKMTIENPDLIKKHHAFAKKALGIYFIILILCLFWSYE